MILIKCFYLTKNFPAIKKYLPEKSSVTMILRRVFSIHSYSDA
ncbi:hypothetical protein CLOL250_00073 [Clostridium sp. L2-50]|nr:hypothetical protein CLOL250_00073 [Clostridium sp. L2-50]